MTVINTDLVPDGGGGKVTFTATLLTSKHPTVKIEGLKVGQLEHVPLTRNFGEDVIGRGFNVRADGDKLLADFVSDEFTGWFKQNKEHKLFACPRLVFDDKNDVQGEGEARVVTAFTVGGVSLCLVHADPNVPPIEGYKFE